MLRKNNCPICKGNGWYKDGRDFITCACQDRKRVKAEKENEKRVLKAHGDY